MRTANAAIKSLYYSEMTAAKTSGDPQQRWAHLERAHIISQPYPWLHTRNHVAMLALAIAQHDRREALGQVIRVVVAAPGSLTGRFPDGNTGRTAAGLLTPMPVPNDLADLLARATASTPRRSPGDPAVDDARNPGGDERGAVGGGR